MSCSENLPPQNQFPKSPPNVHYQSINCSGGRNAAIEKHSYIFEKKFKYTKSSEWKLPPVDELFTEFYQFDNLQQLKHDLNAVKSKLNDYHLEDWSVHTRKKDPCGEIPWKLKTDTKAEFVTIAWCKLFECLHQYEMVKDGTLNSLHLCEAPGAFIAALNHYLHSTFDEVHWKWLSTTLNPYYEGNPINKMIMDDRFMLHTLDRWLFHKDFSGNILDIENIKDMAQKCSERLGDVHLITADGSIDCIDTPDIQEEHVFNLHFGEACAALLILAKGGTFLIKMFTLFEVASVSLVFFFNCIFEEVHVYKPGTSKRGTSELYIICLNYLKPDNIGEYLEAMLGKVTTPNVFPLFPRKYIPTDFYLQHEVCNRKFMFKQMQAIESNIYTYELKSKWQNKHCHELRSQVCQLFFQLYKVRPLAPEHNILQDPGSKIEYRNKIRIHHGSHNLRVCIKNRSTQEQVFHLRTKYNDIEKVFSWQYDEIGCFGGDLTEERIPLKLFKGKPLKELGSSLFVRLDILYLRQKIINLYDVDPVMHQTPICTLGTVEDSDFWSTGSDDEHPTKFDSEKQRNFYSQILKKIVEIQPKTIRFINVMFLTHYGVSILRYLTSNLDAMCRINGNGEIILEMKEITEENTERVRQLYTTLEANPDILCFVDIVHLHRNEFFKLLIEYNSQLLLGNIKALLGTE